MRALTVVSAVLLSGILLFAAVDKAVHYDRFVLALLKNPFVPPPLVSPVATAVVVTEIYVAVCVVIPSLRRRGYVLSAVLFLFFSGVIGALILSSSDSSCGCWMSVGSGRADLSHLLLNIACGLLSVFLWWAGGSTAEETAAAGTTRVRCG
jgi:hypothetical protein